MPHQPESLMLFTAGFGTRMGALTADRPKPLIEVAGRPLVDHALDLCDQARIARVVANLHYKPDALAAHLQSRNVQLSYEIPTILETGGGLRQALPLLGDNPVFTLNSDAVWRGDNPLTLLARAWEPERMDALLMLIRPENALGHTGAGDFMITPDQRLVRAPGLIYSGAQIIRTELLHDISDEAFSLNLLWDRFQDRRRLFGIEYRGRWCDVGRPESIALAEAMLDDADV